MNSLDILPFFAPLLTISIAELGDKTMFLVMALASKHKSIDVIAGVTIGAVVLNLFAVGVGSVIGNILPAFYFELIAGVLFLYFAVYTIIESRLKKEKKDNIINLKIKPFILISIIFIIAEFGDKTQFTTISIAASSPGNEVPVFLGSFIGLLLGDSIGLIIGKLLGRRIPVKIFALLSAAVFALFGIFTLIEAVSLLSTL